MSEFGKESLIFSGIAIQGNSILFIKKSGIPLKKSGMKEWNGVATKRVGTPRYVWFLGRPGTMLGRRPPYTCGRVPGTGWLGLTLAECNPKLWTVRSLHVRNRLCQNRKFKYYSKQVKAHVSAF